MKKIIIGLVLLALVATGAYAGFGLVARQNIMAGMATVQEQIPGIIEQKVTGGLMRSQLHFRIPLPHLAEVDPNAALVIDETLYHGPLIWQDEDHAVPTTLAQAYGVGTVRLDLPALDIPQAARALLQADLTIQVPVVGATLVRLRGQQLNQRVALADQGSLQVEWQGFSLDLTFPDNSLLSYSLDFTAPLLQVTGSDGDLVALRGLSASGTMAESESGLSVGSLTSTLAEVEARLVEQDDHLVARDLSAIISTKEEEKKLAMEEILSLASLEFDDKLYKDFHFHLALRNLPAPTLVALAQSLQELEGDPAAQNDPQLAQQKIMEIIQEHGPTLLAGSPELVLEDMSASTPQGLLRLRGAVRFNGQGQVLLNPIFLLGRLSAEALFEADEEALAQVLLENTKASICAEQQDMACDQQARDQVEAMLAEQVAAGVLTRSNKGYRYTMTYKDGQILVNGKPQPFPLANLGS